MPRSNQPRKSRPQPRRKWSEAPELDLERARAGIPTRESGRDGVWSVRRITEQNASKHYLCPGCHRDIPPGVAHLVAWQEDSLFGAETALADRRHWHLACWRTRRSG